MTSFTDFKHSGFHTVLGLGMKQYCLHELYHSIVAIVLSDDLLTTWIILASLPGIVSATKNKYLVSLIVSISLFFLVSFFYKLKVAVINITRREAFLFMITTHYPIPMNIIIEKTACHTNTNVVVYHPVLLSFVFDNLFHLSIFHTRKLKTNLQ